MDNTINYFQREGMKIIEQKYILILIEYFFKYLLEKKEKYRVVNKIDI